MNRKTLPLLAGLLLLPIMAIGQTTTLYTCVGNHGETSFQDQPCASKGRTKGVYKVPQTPAKQYTGQRVTLNLRHIELAKVVQVLSQAGDVDLRVDPRADMFVDVTVVNEPWDKVLDELMARHNLRFRVANGVGYVF